jgi:outer membrane immunogenic protein
MRKLLLAALAACFALPAVAADMAIKAPPSTGSPYYDYFSGFYIGAHGGVGWDRGAGSASDPFGTMGFATAPFGFVGGLHAGYNFHSSGPFVFGIEADGDVATLTGTVNNPGFIGSIDSKNRWLASVRGRLGVLVSPTGMIYATGGWGWAGSSFTVTGTDGSQFSTSPTLNGAVIGGGIEHALGPNWGIRVEYLHYFLGDLAASTTGSVNGGPIVPIGANVSTNTGVARAGISYHF